MYADDALIPISALQHYVVCPRQCALIHLEQDWVENTLTAEGRAAHERVDRGGAEQRGAVRQSYGVPLRNVTLGLVGRADMVEFHRSDTAQDRPFPVEHKRGKPKRGDEDRVQLCAQALCLEEMLNVAVPAGALFYGQKRRRLDVAFDAPLRSRVASVVEHVRTMVANNITPPPPPNAPCKNCSLLDICQPDIHGRSVRRWVANHLADPAQ